MATLLGQQGAWIYMVEDGTAEFNGTEQEMARVYDRQAGTLSDPWPVQALLARGYWEQISSLPETQKLVSEEIDSLTAR